MVLNRLFGRSPGEAASAVSNALAPEPPDSPKELAAELFRVVRFVNSVSGQLPPAAVVTARRITDTINLVLLTTRDRELDIHARVSLNGMLRDYLPTTLRTFLALDPAGRERPAANGITPTVALTEQLDFLLGAALEALTAVRNDDANALLAQGSFLRTKFARSELDL